MPCSTPAGQLVAGACQLNSTSDLKWLSVRTGGAVGGDCEGLQQAMPQHFPSQVPQQQQ
jgi:hypothetical protein